MLWKIAAPVAAATLLTIGVSWALIVSQDLGTVEVFFYDKDSKTKRIKLLTSSPMDEAQREIFEEGTDGSEGRWKNSLSVPNAEEKTMWSSLLNIGSKYIQVQRALNTIRMNLAKPPADPDCSGDACCKNKSPNCLRCICCSSGSGSVDFNEVKRVHKTFLDLIRNQRGKIRSIYLKPTQAHIKLHDVSFEELKKSSGSSTDPKFFDGTLIYAFVNRFHQPTHYTQQIPAAKRSEYSDLPENTHIQFFNLPQTLSFSLNKSSKGSSQTTDKSIDINHLYSDLENGSLMGLQRSEYTDATDHRSCCCVSADPDKCLVTRNYILLRKDQNENIGDKIKNISKCSVDGA